MKKYLILIVSAVAIFGLSGCGGGGDDHHPIEAQVLYLLDEQGASYAGVPYRCDSMSAWEFTSNAGGFLFYSPESCEFDFTGLRGNLFNDPGVDDIVHIVDDHDYGYGGIPYECSSFGTSTTFGNGSFEYDINDKCVFHL